MDAEYARAGEGIGETRMQSLTVIRDRLEQIEADLKDTQSKLSETLPKLVATREQLAASLVRAPVTGQVVGLTGLHRRRRGRAGPEADGHRPRRTRAGHPAQLQADRRRRRLSRASRRRFASSASTTARCRCSPARCGPCRPTASPTRRPAASYFRAEIVVPEGRAQPGSLGARPGRASARASRSRRC